jgi:hypothetical protein
MAGCSGRFPQLADPCGLIGLPHGRCQVNPLEPLGLNSAAAARSSSPDVIEWREEEGFVVRESLVVLLGPFAATFSAAQTRSPENRRDEESIRAMMAATTDAFSRHDAKAWVKFCTPDAPQVTVR